MWKRKNCLLPQRKNARKYKIYTNVGFSSIQNANPFRIAQSHNLHESTKIPFGSYLISTVTVSIYIYIYRLHAFCLYIYILKRMDFFEELSSSWFAPRHPTRYARIFYPCKRCENLRWRNCSPPTQHKEKTIISSHTFICLRHNRTKEHQIRLVPSSLDVFLSFFFSS